MRQRALGAAIAALALFTAACGGTADDSVDPEAAEEVTAEPTEEATTELTEEPTEEATTGGTGGTTVLIGMVGTAEDPEAFEITLTDEFGEPITAIPAGDYTIQVSDPATSHNFHLTGGSADETTSVPELEETTFEVTLEPGEYTYACDPHPSMTGTFTVT